MSTLDLRQRIIERLNTLSFDELRFIDRLITDVLSYLHTKQITPAQPPTLETHPPLAAWQDDEFMGSFEAEPDLAEQSEQIVHNLFAQNYVEP